MLEAVGLIPWGCVPLPPLEVGGSKFKVTLSHTGDTKTLKASLGYVRSCLQTQKKKKKENLNRGTTATPGSFHIHSRP